MRRQAIPTYGDNLLAQLDPAFFDQAVVVCAPEGWELCRRQFPKAPLAVVDSFSMEQSELEAMIRALPQARTVFGIGGGSACDAAKMYAWMNTCQLVLVPTILSVDAPYTAAVGVRVGHHVRYVGQVCPDHLLVDFALIGQSPPRLNRAGIGDVLSIHTALFDWQLASVEVGEDYNPDIAAQSAKLFAQLADGADEVRLCNERGLRLISDLYVAEVALCDAHGNSRPEEGSEHYLAYCLESLTHGHYLHGELIALTTLLTSLYQNQGSAGLLDVIRRTGVAFHPEDVGTSYEELEKALLALPEFLAEEKQLPYGIYHHFPPDAERARELLARLDSILREAG